MNSVSTSAVVNPLHAARGNRFWSAHDRFIHCPRGSLLLQSRVISRRRCDGRRRGTRRPNRSPAAESHNRSDDRRCAKSLHIIPPGADAADMRTGAYPKFILHRRHFKATEHCPANWNPLAAGKCSSSITCAYSIYKTGIHFCGIRASGRPTISRPDLLRRQPGGALAAGFGALDQRNDAARQRHLQPVPIGDLRDDALEVIDFGAPAALQVFPHR
jgi:hypothetical protein